jgi:DNA topoisomerase VI subunit B
MFPSFDVFQIDGHGRVVWKGFVESVVVAKATIRRLMLVSPSDYLILDQSSGERLVVPRNSGKLPEAPQNPSPGFQNPASEGH